MVHSCLPAGRQRGGGVRDWYFGEFAFKMGASRISHNFGIKGSRNECRNGSHH